VQRLLVDPILFMFMCVLTYLFHSLNIVHLKKIILFLWFMTSVCTVKLRGREKKNQTQKSVKITHIPVKLIRTKTW
jgi:L-asparagine transporter-like permease